MLTAFDVGFGVLVLISAILATARGLTREVLSLVTWAGSAAFAWYMFRYHPEIAEGFIREKIVAEIATVVVSFIIALVILHLVTMRIADFVVDSRVGALDRTLGFVFGALRGILIAVVIVIFGLFLFPDPSNLPDWASQSKSLPMLTQAGNRLISALPTQLEEELTNILKPKSAASSDLGTGNNTATPDGTSPNGTSPNDNSGLAAPDSTAPPAGTPNTPAGASTPGAAKI